MSLPIVTSISLKALTSNNRKDFIWQCPVASQADQEAEVAQAFEGKLSTVEDPIAPQAKNGKILQDPSQKQQGFGLGYQRSLCPISRNNIKYPGRSQVKLR
jgi:hypothetical protein